MICCPLPLNASSREPILEQSMMVHLLQYLLRQCNPERAILCRSRKMADSLSESLRSFGFAARRCSRSQAARACDGAISHFANHPLVATDLVARGIDVEGVTYVSIWLPLAQSSISTDGRTGRRGRRVVLSRCSVPMNKAE